jgi:hypothetical protein
MDDRGPHEGLLKLVKAVRLHEAGSDDRNRS